MESLAADERLGPKQRIRDLKAAIEKRTGEKYVAPEDVAPVDEPPEPMPSALEIDLDSLPDLGPGRERDPGEEGYRG